MKMNRMLTFALSLALATSLLPCTMAMDVSDDDSLFSDERSTENSRKRGRDQSSENFQESFPGGFPESFCMGKIRYPENIENRDLFMGIVLKASESNLEDEALGVLGSIIKSYENYVNCVNESQNYKKYSVENEKVFLERIFTVLLNAESLTGVAYELSQIVFHFTVNQRHGKVAQRGEGLSITTDKILSMTHPRNQCLIGQYIQGANLGRSLERLNDYYAMLCAVVD